MDLHRIGHVFARQQAVRIRTWHGIIRRMSEFMGHDAVEVDVGWKGVKGAVTATHLLDCCRRQELDPVFPAVVDPEAVRRPWNCLLHLDLLRMLEFHAALRKQPNRAGCGAAGPVHQRRTGRAHSDRNAVAGRNVGIPRRHGTGDRSCRHANSNDHAPAPEPLSPDTTLSGHRGWFNLEKNGRLGTSERGRRPPRHPPPRGRRPS